MKLKRQFSSILALALAVLMVLSFAACAVPEKKLTLSKSSMTLTVGDSEKLTATTEEAGIVVFKTSDDAVATVAQDGTVTAVGEGNCTITAEIAALSATCAVTVKGEEEGNYSAVVDGEVNFSSFPTLNELDTLDVIEYDFGTSKSSQQGEAKFGEMITLSVLQGLTARVEGTKSGIYLSVKEGGVNDHAYTTWLDEMKSMRNIIVTTIKDTDEKTAFTAVVEKYKDIVTKTDSGNPGYVLYEQKITDGVDNDNNPIQKGEQNVNAACTISAATGYLAVDVRNEKILQDLGFELAVDARDMTEIDAYHAYKDQLSSDIIMLTNNGQVHNRDYGIAAKAFYMYESNKDDNFMNEITEPSSGKYKQGTLTVGWSSTGEVDQVNRHALYGFNFTCTNYSYNLSQTARYGAANFKQKSKGTKLTADPNKKYVSFIMTDGDNITWHQNDFPFSEGWYGYSGRGDFKMGWTMAPLMADIAPSVIKHEYEAATKNDSFVCGVSGSGYVYPSEYGMNEDSLKKLAMSTNEYMRRADLDYVEILDNTPFDPTVMNAYASQPDIKGGIVLANYNYYKQGGDIKYYNGKPFVGVGEAMWSDTPGRVAHRLNSLPVDVTSANGYTIVKIHCWSTSMADVARMVEMLDDNIEIVAPGEIMQLVADNVKADSKRTAMPDVNYPSDVDEYVDAEYFYNRLTAQEKTDFQFNTFMDYEGWEKYIGSKQYDYVSFSGEPWKYSTSIATSVDGDGYSIRLDGSDYGNVDDNPNAAIYSKLKVTDSDKARFSFYVRGEAYGFDACYRVRVIVLENGKPTIKRLDEGWMEAGDSRWREVSYDVSAYRGQEVVFIIEHNSTQREGDGEILYIDNIKMGEESLDIASIKKAAVNDNLSATFDTDACGFNMTGAAEYSSGALKATLTATTSGDRADAVFYTKYDLKNYKDYTHTKFGIWAKADSGKEAYVRLAIVSADGKQILRSGDYVKVGDRAQYLSTQFDTFRIKGGAFKYAHAIIEVKSAGVATALTLDNADFATMTRDITKGYYFDAEYLNQLAVTDAADLSELENWTLEGGRGVEDEAKIVEGQIRLYGYDFMRGDDTAIVSKALGGYAKVKNEYNARMFAKLNVSAEATLSFTVKRIEKTLTGLNAVTPQIRVLFIEGNTVTVLKDFEKIEAYTARNISVDLTSVNGRSGVIMIEMDCSQNGDRAGVMLDGMVVA